MRERDAIVYFVGAGGAGVVKIGYTTHPVDRRLRQLMAGSPVALDLLAWGHGDRAYERAFHEFFAEDWSHGEWFRLTERMVAMTQRIGMGGELSGIIDPALYPRGIFAAHVLAGYDTERVRRLDPEYIPAWAVEP